MDLTLDGNMVIRLFFCPTLTGHGGGRTLFVQAGAESSDTDAEAVKPDPRCSWQDHSRRVSADVGNESTGSLSVLQSLRTPLVICPECRTSVVLVK